VTKDIFGFLRNRKKSEISSGSGGTSQSRRTLRNPEATGGATGITRYLRNVEGLTMSSDVIGSDRDQRYHLVLEEPRRADGLFGILKRREEPLVSPGTCGMLKA
jgi:hypothetical protein